MADQTVRITNIPNSGSPERVAFDLLEKIMIHGDKPPTPDVRKHILDLYHECLTATRGMR